MEKFLVLGSNSFSGSHFVKTLLGDSQVSTVFGVSRSPEPNSVFLPYKNHSQLGTKFRFHAFDVNHHLSQIIELVRDEKVDYVVNFAAQGMVAESWLHPEHWFQTNTVGMVKLHNELRKFNNLKKYVHISTPEVYGSTSGNITENTNYNPSTPYAVSRAATDLSLMSFYKNYNFPVVFTRAANVFGPCQQLYRIIPKTILSIRLGKKIPLHGGGRSVRSFIHIYDVAQGTLDVARKAAAPSIYHFSTTRQISIRECVALICEKMKTPFSSAVEITDDRPGKDQAYLLDSTKAQKEFGWTPKISLEQGIQETIAWVDQNLSVLKTLPDFYEHKP